MRLSFANLKELNYNLLDELFVITSFQIIVVNLEQTEDKCKVKVLLDVKPDQKKYLKLNAFIKACNEQDRCIYKAIEISSKAVKSKKRNYRLWVIEYYKSKFSMALYLVYNEIVSQRDTVKSSSCLLFQNDSLQYADIAFDGRDKVFISDKINNAVYIFSSDGTFERQLLSLEHGLDKPVSLSFDISKNLYICFTGMQRNLKVRIKQDDMQQNLLHN